MFFGGSKNKNKNKNKPAAAAAVVISPRPLQPPPPPKLSDLAEAVLAKSITRIRLLAQAGRDLGQLVDQPRRGGGEWRGNLLHLAVLYGADADVAMELRRHGCPIDTPLHCPGSKKHGMDVLTYAQAHQCTSILDVATKLEFLVPDLSPLARAVVVNDTAAVKMQLTANGSSEINHPISVQRKGGPWSGNLLHLAVAVDADFVIARLLASKSHCDIFQRLSAPGTAEDGMEPLEYAAALHRDSIHTVLGQNYKKNLPTLWKAVEKGGSVDMARRVIDLLNVNVAAMHRTTFSGDGVWSGRVIHHALLRQASDDVIALLLERGADPTAIMTHPGKPTNEMNALQLARHLGRDQAVLLNLSLHMPPACSPSSPSNSNSKERTDLGEDELLLPPTMEAPPIPWSESETEKEKEKEKENNKERERENLDDDIESSSPSSTGTDWVPIAEWWISHQSKFSPLPEPSPRTDEARHQVESAVARQDYEARDAAVQALLDALTAEEAELASLIRTPWVLDLHHYVEQAHSALSCRAPPLSRGDFLASSQAYLSLHHYLTQNASSKLPFLCWLNDEAILVLRDELSAQARAVESLRVRWESIRAELDELPQLQSAAPGLCARLAEAHSLYDTCAKHVRRAKLLALEDEPNSHPSSVDTARRAFAESAEQLDAVRWMAHRLAVSDYYPDVAAAVHRLGLDDYSNDSLELSVRSLDAYIDRERLPSGGRHAIFSATRVCDGQSVVLKEYVAGDRRELRRLTREVRVLRRLAEVAGVVRVGAVFVSKGRAFVEFPRYPYGSLTAWVNSEQPSQSARLNVAQRLLSTLDQLHRSGLVHGDIKPDNVFVDEHGGPLLGDLETCQDEVAPTATLTRGTAGYLAPELLAQPSARTTAAADVFAMGATLATLFAENSPEALFFRSQLCADSPAARPSAAHAASSPLFGSARLAGSLPVVGPPYFSGPWNGLWPTRVDVTPEIGQLVQQFVDATAPKEWLTTSVDRLEVVRVERIESARLWARYAAQREDVARRWPNGVPSIHPPVETQSMLEDHVRADLNEVFLFHATRWSVVPHVLRDGFDMRVGSGLFGAGVYLAEDAGKSDHYAVDDENRGGLLPLFLSRVTLGRLAETLERRPDTRRPPCIRGHFDPVRCSHERADCLVAPCRRKHPEGLGALDRHREFILFDNSSIYPEYLISYRRWTTK